MPLLSGTCKRFKLFIFFCYKKKYINNNNNDDKIK